MEVNFVGFDSGKYDCGGFFHISDSSYDFPILLMVECILNTSALELAFS